MGWTELKSYRLTCDGCGKDGPTMHISMYESKELPEGWSWLTLHGCGMTGYTRNEILCPECIEKSQEAS